MKTTLVDFYLTALPLYIWVWIREASVPAKLGWILFQVCLGSAATWFYILVVSLRCRAGDPLAKLLLGAAA